MSHNKNLKFILYDGECPFCNNYAMILKLRKDFKLDYIGSLREESQYTNLIKEYNLNPEDGIILYINGEVFQGHRAMTMISRFQQSKGFVNSFYKFLFINSYISQLIYPIAKIFRIIALKIKGVEKLN